jgi:hypothetical protein
MPSVATLRRELLDLRAGFDRLAVFAAPRPSRPLDWNRHFLPRYFTHEPASFHHWLNEHLDDLHARRGSRTALIAPREGAKSTWCTLAYPLRCALEAWEPYILIVSDSGDQANKLLFDLRAELEENAELAEAYPDSTGFGAGEWREGAVRLRNGVLIESLGRGAKIRGRRNRSARPSLIVLDDVQSNRDIISALERQRTWDWFTREVLPCGTESTNILSVGTALHREAVAIRAGSLPGWIARTFPAVLEWPEREDLWQRWELLATNLADEHRDETAAQFYEHNRDDMDAGAETFWPDRKPIAILMAKRAEIGASAFNTEYQGQPESPEGAEWPAEYFDRPDMWFDEWPAQMVYRIQSLDPSKGVESPSTDYQAHVLLGIGIDGTLYVEADLRKQSIIEMVDTALDLARLRGLTPLDALAIENNDSLGMVVEEFKRRIQERRLLVPLCSVRNSQPKVVRIRRLGLYFGTYRVRFRNTPGTRKLVDQLREFPMGQFDDGPDSLEIAIRRAELLANPE